jgi:hypothetical protein
VSEESGLVNVTLSGRRESVAFHGVDLPVDPVR